MPQAALLLLAAALVGVRLLMEPLVAELLGCAGAVLAAMSFSSGDPPRRPWLLRALGVGAILVAHALQRLGVGPSGLVAALVIAANLVGVAAVLGFLRVVRDSGLTLPLTRRERLLGLALSGATLALVAWIFVELVGVRDPLRAAVVAVSTVGDAVVFVTSALLLRLVLALRGGLVAQPYFLLALDGLFFLLADLAAVVAFVGVAEAVPILGAVGGAAGAAAGFAQAALVRRSLVRASGSV